MGDCVSKITFYEKHELVEFITVDSLVSIYHANLRGRTFKGEAHNFPELIYVESGILDVTIDGNQFSFCAGQCVFYPPCAYHIAQKENSAVVDMIGFESSSPALAELYNRIIVLTDKQQQMLSQIISIGGRAFKDAPIGKNMTPRKNTDALTLHKLKNSLELFLIDLYENISAEPKEIYSNYRLKQFDEVTRYLKTNVDKKLSVEDMASNCGMSVSKLKILFHEQSNLSPMAYFISLKIEKAKELIRDTALNFTQISEMLGFKSVYYFSERFKKKTGMSPSEYAKNILP